jgi:hypothetical protein
MTRHEHRFGEAFGLGIHQPAVQIVVARVRDRMDYEIEPPEAAPAR